MTRPNTPLATVWHAHSQTVYFFTSFLLHYLSPIHCFACYWTFYSFTLLATCAYVLMLHAPLVVVRCKAVGKKLKIYYCCYFYYFDGSNAFDINSFLCCQCVKDIFWKVFFFRKNSPSLVLRIKQKTKLQLVTFFVIIFFLCRRKENKLGN